MRVFRHIELTRQEKALQLSNAILEAIAAHRNRYNQEMTHVELTYDELELLQELLKDRVVTAHEGSKVETCIHGLKIVRFDPYRATELKNEY